MQTYISLLKFTTITYFKFKSFLPSYFFVLFFVPFIDRLTRDHRPHPPFFFHFNFSNFRAPVQGEVTMGDSFTLPLRPVSDHTDRLDTLPVEISQINQQWGSFRDVNEEVLRAKVAEERERGEAPETEDETSSMDTTKRLELLYKRRADMLQFAM